MLSKLFLNIPSHYFVCCGRCYENFIFVENHGPGHLGGGFSGLLSILVVSVLRHRFCFTEVSFLNAVSLTVVQISVIVGHPVGSGVGGGSQRCRFLLLMEWVKAIGRGLISHHAHNRFIQTENRIIAPPPLAPSDTARPHWNTFNKFRTKVLRSFGKSLL